MPEYFATFYAAIVLVWYLDRVARNSRPRCFVMPIVKKYLVSDPHSQLLTDSD